ncbi:MAG: alpha/beta fold hydrolase [Thermoplasmatota archaeon]
MERPTWVDDDLYPFADHWLDLDGHRLHYIDEGPRDAPVLLFAHPGMGWSFTWRNHILALRDRYRCVALDQPGHGLSEAAPGFDHSLKGHAAALEAFVERLDLRDVTLWANDAGGPTGMLVAGRHPDRMVGLVVGGTFGWDIGAYPEVTRFLGVVTGRGFRWLNRRTNLLARTQRRLAYGTRSLTKAEGRHYTRPYRDRAARERTLDWFAGFTDPDVAAELEANLTRLRHLPCLILFGAKDAMTKQGWNDRWVAEFPDHDAHLLPKVDHFPFEDAPDATLAAFKAWAPMAAP